MDETKYGIADFAAKARELFETTPEVVTVALRTAGKETATKAEAAQTIKAFLEKEVK